MQHYENIERVHLKLVGVFAKKRYHAKDYSTISLSADEQSEILDMIRDLIPQEYRDAQAKLNRDNHAKAVNSLAIALKSRGL